VARLRIDLPDAVPDEIRETIEFHQGDLMVPDDVDVGTLKLYQMASEGKCMTCHSTLGQDTMLGVNRHGIVLIFCCGPCYTDMQIMGWLQEHYDDMIQSIQFRGGRGDRPE
jgi:hypothetical protein